MTPPNSDTLIAVRGQKATLDGFPLTFSFTTDVTATTTSTQLYTTGGALDNVCPPGGTCITAHQGRIWVGGTPDDTIWFSKEYVSGERPGFSEGLTIQPFQGGRVVAIQSLDQFLIVFKQTSVYAISGQGPDDLGNNSSYSEPPILASGDVGCIDANSIAYTPEGVMFRGQRGIYIIKKSLEVEFVGRAVEDILTSSVTITGAVTYPKDSQSWFFCNNGSVLVFDFLNKAWSKFSFKNSAGSAITPVAGCTLNGDLYFADTALNLYKYDRSSYLDGGITFVPMTFTTTFAKPENAALEGWHRLKSVSFKLERISSEDVGVNTTVLRDYDITSSDSRSWTDTEMNTLTGGAAGKILQVFPSVQKVSSFAATYSDVVANTPNGGQGYAVQGFSVEVVTTPKPTKRASSNRK